MAHDSLIWEKQLLHICKRHATSSSTATATRTQIWPYHKTVQGHPSIIISTKSVDFESLTLYTKIQPELF